MDSWCDGISPELSSMITFIGELQTSFILEKKPQYCKILFCLPGTVSHKLQLLQIFDTSALLLILTACDIHSKGMSESHVQWRGLPNLSSVTLWNSYKQKAVRQSIENTATWRFVNTIKSSEKTQKRKILLKMKVWNSTSYTWSHTA